MYPIRRFATTVVHALRGARIDVLDTVTIALPVRRSDVEATRMNNGRYLTLMDLGRYALTLRGGYLPVLAKRRWYPLVTGVLIGFHRSLRVGSTFELSTRIVCWDAKSFYLEQWFSQKGDIRAHALVKAVFMGPGRLVTPEELLVAGGFGTTSPEVPASVLAWETAQREAFGVARREGRPATAAA